MNLRSRCVAFTCLALTTAACSSNANGPPGPTGDPGHDSGAVAIDIGLDGGIPGVDANSPSVDAGSPPTDSGTGARDGGIPDDATGSADVVHTDAAQTVDAGSPCDMCSGTAQSPGGACESALAACQASAGCATLEDCLNGCTSSTCASTCFGAASEADGTLFEDLIGCLCSDACPSECAAECAVGDAGAVDAGTGACSEAGAAEFASCETTADCACPYACGFDPNAGASVCMQPCAETSDCASVFTTCQAGSCAVSFCETTLTGASAPGTYDSPCNSAGTNDGTCFEASSNGANYGTCIQGGTASSTCLPLNLASRQDPSTLCPAGQLCFPLATGNACVAVCDPTGVSGPACPAGYACLGGDESDPQSGGCQPQ